MQCMCRARVPLSSSGLWCTWRETCARPRPSKRTPASRHTCRSVWICWLCIWVPPLQSYWVHTNTLPARVVLLLHVDLVKAGSLLLLFSSHSLSVWSLRGVFLLHNSLCSDNSLTLRLLYFCPWGMSLEFSSCVCLLYFQVVENIGCINCKSTLSELSFTFPLIFSSAFCFIPCFVSRQCLGCTPGCDRKEAPVYSSEQTAEADLAHIGYSAGASFIKGTLA